MKRLFQILAIIALCAVGVRAQNVAVTDAAILNANNTLRPIPGAQITVCALGDTSIPCTSKVTIYAGIASATPATNPVTADANGNYTYYLPAGNYTETTTLTGYSGKSVTRSAGGAGSSTTPTFPVTVINGVSGGIPCFTSTVVEAASGLLGLNQILLGGGAGQCPIASASIPSAIIATTQPATDTSQKIATMAAVHNAVTAIAAHTISVLDPTYGGVNDGYEIANVNINAGTGNVTVLSGTPFVPGNVGKILITAGYCLQAVGHIDAYTDSTHIHISNASTASGSVYCNGWIGTDNLAAATAACAASTAANPLNVHFPGGNPLTQSYLMSDGGFCNLTNAANGATTMYGDGTNSTNFVVPQYALTKLALDIEDINATVRDWSLDIDVLGTGGNMDIIGGGSVYAAVALNSAYVYRVAVNNLTNQNAVQCMSMSTDHSEITEPISHGCQEGFGNGSQPNTIIRPQFTALKYGLHNFDVNTRVYGGAISGGTAGVYADTQGSYSSLWLDSVAVGGGTSALQTNSGGGAAYVHVNGGFYGTGSACGGGHTKPINIDSGGVVEVRGAELSPCNETAVTNAGTFIDSGGNDPTGHGTHTGTGAYSGAGIVYNSANGPSVNGPCLAATGASPEACGASSYGIAAIPTTTTTYVINTKAITAASVITLTPTTDCSGVSGAPTCVAPSTLGGVTVSARTAGTSFTITLPSTTGIVGVAWAIR